jgi:hypothetical protein
VAAVRQVVDADPDAAGKPIYFTEMGWPSFGTVDPGRQAQFLVRGLLLGASAGISALCWYTLLEGPHPDQFPPEDAFGLVTTAGERKPAFHAFRTLVATIGQARFTRDVTGELGLAPGQARALLFLEPARAVTAVWTLSGSSNVTLPVRPSSTRSVVAPDGTATALDPDVAAVSLTVGEAPIYLVEER